MTQFGLVGLLIENKKIFLNADVDQIIFYWVCECSINFILMPTCFGTIFVYFGTEKNVTV